MRYDCFSHKSHTYSVTLIITFSNIIYNIQLCLMNKRSFIHCEKLVLFHLKAQNVLCQNFTHKN